MATLIIHAPKEKVDEEHRRSFRETFTRNVGSAYAIPKSDVGKLRPGDKIVLLSKDEKRRAEGTLVQLVPKERTKTGMQRYDVHVKDFKEVKYKSEPLGRTGVSVVF